MRPNGMRHFICLVALLATSAMPTLAIAQGRPAGPEFQITKINRNLITAPNFTYTGAQQYAIDERAQWLEVEVEFAAAPEYTDELTFKYYILINGKLLTGEVTHTNVAAGRDNRSVMYVSPKTLARVMGNRPMQANAVRNIAVQIVQQGAVKSEASMDRAAPQWFASLPQISGFVLNKNETPFAPLFWDRYEQIKAAGR
ncbi:MAG: hypothetical protein M3Y80_04050 [Verrucomicrobiota bacterium]|nr:hypothetical protein [Verrucomicrobiota bacterium]